MFEGYLVSSTSKRSKVFRMPTSMRFRHNTALALLTQGNKHCVWRLKEASTPVDGDVRLYKRAGPGFSVSYMMYQRRSICPKTTLSDVLARLKRATDCGRTINAAFDSGTLVREAIPSTSQAEDLTYLRASYERADRSRKTPD